MNVSGLFTRRLINERVAALGLALLIFVTGLGVAVAPRLLEHLANEALHSELAAAPAFERHTVIYETARRTAEPPPEMSDADEAGRLLAAAFPPEVRRLIESRSPLVETPLWLVLGGAELDSVVSMRVHPAAFDRLRLVTGRLPTGVVRVVADDRSTVRAGQRSIVYEGILPASAAEEMGVAAGDSLPLTVWLNDPLNIGQNVGAQLSIVGTYELEDPTDDFWINDVTVAGWRLHMVGLNTWLQTTALLSPDSYSMLVGNTHRLGMTLLYQWRFFVDTDRLAAEQLPETVGALRRIEGSLPRSGMSAVPSDTTMSSGLLRLLLRHEAAWRSALSVLSVVAIGALAIALATLAVVAAAASDGRRRLASLLRARGASQQQLLRAGTIEAAVLSLPALGLAIALAMLAVPTGSVPATVVPAALVWATATLILLAITGRRAPTEGAQPSQRVRYAGRLTPRRLVVETALVGGAVAGAVLLRERGVSGASSATELVGGDPLIAAVPALVGIAAGVLAMRLYPLPTRLIAALAGQRRDLVPVLAVRRAVRGGSSATVLLVLVATASVGAFASATVAHLERAAELGAWQDVGAEYRLRSPSQVLPATLDEQTLPGVEAAARAWLRSAATSRGTSWLLVLDPSSYARVAAGTPVDPGFPPSMLTDSGAAMPAALVSDGVGLRRGDVFEVTLGTRPVAVRAEEIRRTFAGVPAGDPFVVLSATQLESTVGARTPAAVTAFLRAAPGSEQVLRDALAASAPGVVLESRAELAQAARSAPVMAALRTLIAAGAAVALAYAALAVGAALILAAAAQRDEVAHLRALGMTRRGQLWLTFIEYGPAALLGYVVGIGLGLGLFAFLRPGLGLTAITGSAVEVPVGVAPAHLAGLLVAIVAILMVGWLLGAIAQRDASPATAIRRGIE